MMRVVHFICDKGVYTSPDGTQFVSAEWFFHGGDNVVASIREVRLHHSKATPDYKRGTVEKWWKDPANDRYIFLCKTVEPKGEIATSWAQEKAFSAYEGA